MKKIHLIKELWFKVTFITTIVLIASCSNNQNSQDPTEVAEEQNEAKFNNSEQEKDAQFLVNAAEMNLEEIQLGKLAQQNGRTSHVKELGKMMEDAHTKSLNDLTALAKGKTVTIPTSLTNNANDAYNNLKDKSADDFDKAYADMMVNEHKDAIAVFEKASTECNDTDIKNWATTSLTSLRTHLDSSIDCQKKCENM